MARSECEFCGKGPCTKECWVPPAMRLAHSLADDEAVGDYCFLVALDLAGRLGRLPEPAELLAEVSGEDAMAVRARMIRARSASPAATGRSWAKLAANDRDTSFFLRIAEALRGLGEGST